MGAIQNYLASTVSATGLTSLCLSNEDLLPNACKVLIVGPHNAVAVTPPTPTFSTVVKIRNMLEAAQFYGVSTALYRALDRAFCSCKTGQAEINVLALPVSAGVAAVYDIAAAGPATATHVKTVSLFGRTFPLLIPTGSTAATIGLILKTALDADPLFPFTSVATATGVTVTAKDQGVFGNGMAVSVSDSRGLGFTDTGFTLTQTTVGSGVLDTASLSSAIGTCCVKCLAIMDDSKIVIDAVQAWANNARSCGPDFCGVMAWFARKESKGLALAFGDGVPGSTSPYNEIIVGLHVHPNMPYPAYDMAVARAVMSCCAACTNPGDPLQNNESRMLCLPFDKSCTNFYTRKEINQLFAAGWTVLDAVAGHIGLEVERTFHRRDDQGRPTIAYSDPTQIRIADYWFNDRFRPWLKDNYGSSILFKDGTTLPLRGVPADAPAFLRNTKTVTPTLLKGAVVGFMERDIGAIFDEQNLREKVFAMTDDQLRELCQGDPRTVVLFFDRVSIARPLRHLFLSFSFTTRTC